MTATKYWHRKYIESRNRCRKRLCALPVGAEIDAEEWYGGGWDTCNRMLRELAGIAKPLFAIRGSSRADSVKAVKVR